MEKTKKKRIIWIAVVLVIIIAGILIVKGSKKREAGIKPAKEYSIVVSSVTPEVKDVELTLPYLALIKNDKDVKLSSRIMGRVNWIKASGSRVKRGEVIARLDNTSVMAGIESTKAQIEAMETALKNLESTHERTLELLKVQGASIEQSQAEESKIAEMNSKVESLKQKLKDLNNTLTYAIIKSPVDGRISQTMLNKGDMATPGRPVASVSAENGFYLLLRVPTSLKISGVNLDGKFYEAMPLNSTFNSLAEYKVYVDKEGLTTGDRLEVEVAIYKDKGILLPFDAVLNRNGKSYVLVINGDRVTPHEVNINQTGEQGIVTNDSSLAGKRLVSAKQDVLLRLLGGTSIKVRED